MSQIATSPVVGAPQYVTISIAVEVMRGGFVGGEVACVSAGRRRTRGAALCEHNRRQRL